MTDDVLRELARAHRRSIADTIDATAELADLKARAASGPSVVSTAPRPAVTPRRRPPIWSFAAAAAAVVALVAAGIVLTRRDEPTTIRTSVPPTAVPPSTDAVAPTTAPAPAPATTQPATAPATTAPSATVPPPTDATQPTAVPPPPTTAPAPGGDGSGLDVGVRCVDGQTCTQLGSTSSGIVAYDPVDETLVLLDGAGAVTSTVPLDEPLSERLLSLTAVGPDDVVYFLLAPIEPGDPIADLVAVPTAGPDAGTVRVVATGLDGSGDTDLVPTPSGLAEVGCCGPDAVRPAPDAVIHPWIDSTGAPVTSTDPHFRYRPFGESGLVRIDPGAGSAEAETELALPAVATGTRGMPWLVATDDGRALLAVFDDLSGASYLARLGARDEAGADDNPQIVLLHDGIRIELLERAGTVIVRDGDRFVRHTLDEVGTTGWPGRLEAAGSWLITAPGLNDHIDDLQPRWAADPLLLARQLVPFLDGGATFEATWDAGAGELTLTTSGLLDDSVGALRTTVVLEVGADGLYRFVAGSTAQQCQPGRGHEDFRQEPCV